MAAEKPLGHRSYGSIGHLPGSRRGPGDHSINEGQARICLSKTRDKHDVIVVQEKLDGSNVSVANVDGVLVPLIRSGYPAISSRFEQHHLFANWVFERLHLFEFLQPGERICGEWLALAHGTRYQLPHDPFVAFDIMRSGHARACWQEISDRVQDRLVTPHLLSTGPPISIEKTLLLLDPRRHGALDPIEGAVWRVERRGTVDFLGKYVRPDKVDGHYLSDISGNEAIWNWRPTP